MTEQAELCVGGISVSRETFSTLKAYEALVRRWTPAINLVSRNTVPALWERHIADSAQVFAVCDTSETRLWADLGSGGGFPGLVVAILARELRPALRVVLVESDMRKTTFLRQAAQALSLDVQVLCVRIEALAPLNADILSARALASLPDLLGYAEKHLRNSGTAIFPKGARYAEELAEARKSWRFDVDTQRSVSEDNASILVIRNIHRAHD